MFRRNAITTGGPISSLRRRVFRIGPALLAGTFGVMLLLAPHDEARAQQRATCLRALQACGKQRICQARYRDCLETGCWTVWRVRRCGYQKR
jgi:hypothetical protein